MTTWRLWPSANGPSTATSFSGPFGTSTGFKVSSYTYLAGYWWWVCAGGSQSTAAQKFALWQVYGSDAATLAGAQVTSGTLTAGAWNYVPLATPVPLTPGVTYRATTAFTGPFPLTAGGFASGGTYAAGITNGPLSAYSDSTGSAPDPWSNYQSGYQTSSTDPAAVYAGDGDSGYVGWLDIQVTDQAPSGGTYRLYPSYPVTPAVLNSQTTDYTLGIEFSLSQAATLNRIWHYSASGAVALPSRCGIWDVTATAEVAGSDNSSPTWSGAAGSGWVSCTYSAGPVLAAGKNYKVSTYSAGGSKWFSAQTGYWNGTGAGASGITNGILTASNEAGSTPGQGSYATGSWAYPSTDGAGETYWLDVEVTPVALQGPVLLRAPATPPRARPRPLPRLIRPAGTAAAVPVALPDTGAAAGTLAVTAAIALPDTAAASDATAATASALLADTGGTADILTATSTVPLPDAGAAADAPDTAITATLPDAGGAADAVAVAGTAALPDAGAAADWSYADGIRTDSGGGGDSLAASVTVQLADTAAAADAMTVMVPVTLADTAAAADAAANGDSIGVADQSAGVDVLTVTAGTVLADAGAAQDWVAADGMRQDAAAAQDTAAVAAGTPLPDPAAASDTVVTGAVAAASDSAAASDATATAATVPVLEAAAAADTLVLVTGESASLPDAAAAAETLTTAVTVTAGDTGASAASFTGEPDTASTGYAAWTVSPLAARWHATPMPPRWKATLMNFAPIAAVSLEEISVLWNSMFAGTELDPTGQTAGQPQLPVQFAFPVSSGNPLAPAEPVDWVDGVWLTGTNIRGYVAQCLTGPGGGVVTLTASTAYDVWGKIAGATETPCKFAGTQAVY